MSRADLYERLEPLGEGGQGCTWEARDTRTGDLVVVKEISLADADDWDAVRRFERECEVLESLKHPCIPRYLDHYSDKDTGRYGLVMELAEGKPLSERGAGLDADDLLSIAHQVLSVLEYLHSRTPAVIHRDIKPANLVMAPDGTLKVVDFGGVKELRGASASGASAFGTFGYMAPEQYRGAASPQSDLFGLGATLLALATGKEPEELPDRPVLGGRVPRVEQLMAAGNLRDTVAALLAPNAQDRPQTVRDVRNMLAHGRTSRVPFSNPKTVARLVLVLLLLVLSGGAMFGYLAIAPREAPPRPARAQLRQTPALPSQPPKSVGRVDAPPLVAASLPAVARYRSRSRPLALSARRSLELAGAADLQSRARVRPPEPTVTDATEPTAADAAERTEPARPAEPAAPATPSEPAAPRFRPEDLHKAARGRVQLLHLQACELGDRTACALSGAPDWRCSVTLDGLVACVRSGKAP